MREQRAFAAVSPCGHVEIETLREDEADVERYAIDDYFVNWDGAQANGWRIRPVLIRVEDNGGGDAE